MRDLLCHDHVRPSGPGDLVINFPLSLGVSYLTAFSIEEDAYGVVQRDVPRVLEALLSFTSALEAYANELEKQTNASNPSSDADPETKDEMHTYLDRRRQEESEAIGELVGPLLTGEFFNLSYKAPGR